MVVLASLTAIAAIVYLVFQYQNGERLADIRSQGVSLVRALSGVPYEQLIPGGQQQGVIQVLRHGANDNDFAYVSIVDPLGTTVNEVTAEGLIVPAARIPPDPSSWLGEKHLELPPDQRKVIEFHAPLLDSGDLQGFVRLGCVYPAAGIIEGMCKGWDFVWLDGQHGQFDYASLRKGLKWMTRFKCDGCKSGGGNPECNLRKCAQEKGVENCGACAELPCTIIDEWKAQGIDITQNFR